MPRLRALRALALEVERVGGLEICGLGSRLLFCSLKR